MDEERTNMSAARLIGWFIAALLGAGATVMISQKLNRTADQDAVENVSVPPDDASATTDAVSPPPLTRPDDARRVVIAGLDALGLSSQAIRQGHYPLRGAGRNLSDVMPLVSFECPVDRGCTSLMAALERTLAAAGMALAVPRTPDRPGRPMYRAVFQDGRPALALRAYPAGGRLAIVIEGVGAFSEDLENSLNLDPDVTYAVQADANGASETAQRLRALEREFIAHVPMGVGPIEKTGTQASLNVKMTPGEIAEQTQTYLDIVAGAAGVNGHHSDAFSASSAHMSPVFEVLAKNGRYFFDQRASDASVASALAKALGVRSVSRTHRIDESHSIDAQLQAVRVALVLEGEAVVVIQPKRDIIEALKPWLAELRKRKFNVMRLSEMVL